MATQPEQMKVQVGEYGAPSQWSALSFAHPLRGEVKGKAFIGKAIGLSGMELSLNALPPGAAQPYLHAHKQNEELYLFLGGEGEFQADGKRIPVKPGTAVRVAPSVMRSWRSTGTETLLCIVIQAKEGSLEQATAQDGILGESAPSWD